MNDRQQQQHPIIAATTVDKHTNSRKNIFELLIFMFLPLLYVIEFQSLMSSIPPGVF